MTLDLKPGPIIGLLLEHIREGQVEGHVQSVEDALRVARNYIEANGS